jgi:hypothetical protein
MVCAPVRARDGGALLPIRDIPPENLLVIGLPIDIQATSLTPSSRSLIQTVRGPRMGRPHAHRLTAGRYWGCTTLRETRGPVPEVIKSADSPLRPFESALRRARLREDSHNAETLYFPSTYDRDMYIALAENSRESVDRVKICASESLSNTSFESSVWRDVASTGVSVRVVYLVSHLGLVKSVLSQGIRLDQEAGIDVRVVAAHMLPDQIAELQLGDSLLIDGRIVAYRSSALNITRYESGLWTISVSRDHVGLLARTFSDTWLIASEPASLPVRLDLEEPLVQSAPVLAQVAPVLCQGDHIDSADCDWYHSVWQFLRLMDLVSTPAWHHDFYTGALDAAVKDGARRILITGTADYSVFAYVLHALREIPEAVVTVVDLCNTPLFACQWFAKRAGFHGLTLLADDVLSYLSKTSDRYDVIVTDAFLTRFVKSAAAELLDGWAKVLDAEGRVITTIRVHAESESGQTQDEAIAGFRERAQVRWRRWAPFIANQASEVADRAEIYARRMVSRPIGTELEIIRLLSVRFNIKSEEIAHVPGELYPTKYMRVILTRKGPNG